MYEEKPSSSDEEIFIKKHKIITENIDVDNGRLIYELTVDTELISLFKKDISMLDKFKDYYKSK